MLRSIALVVAVTFATYAALLWLQPEKVGFPTFLTGLFVVGAVLASDNADIVSALRRAPKANIAVTLLVMIFVVLRDFRGLQKDPWVVPVTLAFFLFFLVFSSRVQRRMVSELRK